MAARSEAHDSGLCVADADTLLANAVRHAPESSPIRIKAVQEDAHVATRASACPEGLLAARGRNSNRPDGNRGGGAPSLPMQTPGASDEDQPVQLRTGNRRVLPGAS